MNDILVPLVVRNLGCSDRTVDRAAHAALIQIIEEGFITKPQIEIQVCPSILALSKGETVEDINANTGAITVSTFWLFYIITCLSLIAQDIQGRGTCSVKDMGSEMFLFFCLTTLSFMESLLLLNV